VGERYARSIINDLNRWTAGWIDWNLLLDERGGPNHVGNFCSAPILADRARGALMHQSAYWVLGHFSRFIRPGSQRVLCASSRADVEATAFRSPAGDVATVAVNRHGHLVHMQLVVDGGTWPISLPPHSISTFVVSAA
jgi:glucosylceramidase